MATAQSHGNQISMENWSSPFWSPSLLGISMWFSSFCSFFPKSDVTPGMLGRFVGGVAGWSGRRSAAGAAAAARSGGGSRARRSGRARCCT